MKFKKEFVRFMWDDKLEGKEVFIGDNIDELINAVETDRKRHTVINALNLSFPFRLADKNERDGSPIYKFVYYDPLYDVKKAHKEGKVIEVRDLISGQWIVPKEPIFLPERAGDYRIKDDKDGDNVTQREISMWLALGKGECKFVDGSSDIVLHSYSYREGIGDELVKDDVRVRAWNDKEWHKPTRKYMRIWEEKDE